MVPCQNAHQGQRKRTRDRTGNPEVQVIERIRKQIVPEQNEEQIREIPVTPTV